MSEILFHKLNPKFKKITEKVKNNERISIEEALLLYTEGELGFLGMLANFIRERKHGDNTYFIRNLHIEPTNICVFNCKFCSYRSKSIADGWEFTSEQIIEKVKSYKEKSIREIHIVGGTHPERDLHYYGNIIQTIKQIFPDIHIKAFSAVELDYMIKLTSLSLQDGLMKLKEYGLDSIPGGGAEIFDEDIRKKICEKKTNAKQWLNIHETAHTIDIPSNATMLYGHIENYTHRIDHMNRLRELQDKTSGFNAFIPLKYKNKNNEMSQLKETSIIEDLKNYAVSRIFLDNFNHIKAYWPMIGKQSTQLSLSLGVDDIDGTIDDSTKIYSLAGAEEQHPSMNAEELTELIKQVKRIPIERDALYNPV